MNPTDLIASAQQFLATNQHAQTRAVLLSLLNESNDNHNAHAMLVTSYVQTNDYRAALRHAEFWVYLQPTHVDALWAYGQLLLALNEHQQGIDILLRLFKIQPDSNFEIPLKIAKTYLHLRQMDKSEPFFEHAMRLSVNNVKQHHAVRWEYAMQQLTQSDYLRGWSNYEARHAIMQENLHICQIPAPKWTGEPLHDKTIVLHGEQGIGDEIMYASIIQDLLDQGARVTLACFPALVELMRTSFPSVNVVPHPRSIDNMNNWATGTYPDWWHALHNHNQTIDYQLPIGSLAHHYRNRRTDFPRTPYLKIDEARKNAITMRMHARAHEQGINLSGKTLIALAWCGNLSNPHGRAKSLDLASFKKLGKIARQHNAVFISLQNSDYGEQAIEAHKQGVLPVVDMSADTDAFANTLALAAACDHIITIDTSYFHLCGAAGLKPLLLLRRNCDWRFGWTIDFCDWYDGVEIIRQDIDGEWAPVIQKTEEKLLKWLT